MQYHIATKTHNLKLTAASTSKPIVNSPVFSRVGSFLPPHTKSRQSLSSKLKHSVVTSLHDLKPSAPLQQFSLHCQVRNFSRSIKINFIVL